MSYFKDSISYFTEIKGATWSAVTDTLELIRNTISSISITPNEASCSATGTIVEVGATGTPSVFTLTSDGSSNTFGSWVQIDASLSADSNIHSLIISTLNVNPDFVWTIELGTGAGGSEVTKIRFSGCTASSTAGTGSDFSAVVFPLGVLIKFTAGTRIAARFSDSINAAKTVNISVQYARNL